MPRAPGVGEGDLDEFDVGKERASSSAERYGASGELRIDAKEKGHGAGSAKDSGHPPDRKHGIRNGQSLRSGELLEKVERNGG